MNISQVKISYVKETILDEDTCCVMVPKLPSFMLHLRTLIHQTIVGKVFHWMSRTPYSHSSQINPHYNFSKLIIASREHVRADPLMSHKASGIREQSSLFKFAGVPAVVRPGKYGHLGSHLVVVKKRKLLRSINLFSPFKVR